MVADHRLALHATLPDRYAQHEVLASTIDHRGRLTALVTDPARYLSEPRYEATAVICDGPEIHEIPLTDLSQEVTLIDTHGDGIVLATARCEPTGIAYERRQEPVPENELHLTHNVQVIDESGQTQSAFYAGDGIGQLMTDARGTIWISYSDESNYWSPNPDGTRSYGFAIGLTRWNSDGSQPWMAPLHTPDIFWCECYAMNVGRDTVHACPYPDFPLIEIANHGIRTITSNPITSCNGLAISGDEIAFLDQHRTDGEFRWEIRRAHRQNGVVTETARLNLLLPHDRPPTGWARGRIGRDETLWLHEDGNPRHWYRYEITA